MSMYTNHSRIPAMKRSPARDETVESGFMVIGQSILRWSQALQYHLTLIWFATSLLLWHQQLLSSNITLMLSLFHFAPPFFKSQFEEWINQITELVTISSLPPVAKSLSVQLNINSKFLKPHHWELELLLLSHSVTFKSGIVCDQLCGLLGIEIASKIFFRVLCCFLEQLAV